MSHITHVKTQIRDRETLLQVLADLSCEAREGRGAGPGEDEGGSPEITVWRGAALLGTFHRKARDPAYTLTLDREGARSSRGFGHRVQQAYARRKILAEARRRNYVVVRETVCADSKIRMVLRKVA